MKREARKEKGWAQLFILFLLFSSWSLEMIEIYICFNLLPLRNIEAVALRCSVKKGASGQQLY